MDPAEIAQITALATEHQRARRYLEAETLCAQIILAEPDHAPTWHLLGILSDSQGRVRIAKYFILEAIERDDTRPGFYSNLGECCRRLKEWDEALLAYRCALRLDPNFQPALHNMSLALLNMKKLDQAEQVCRRALELKPRSFETWNVYGNIHQERGDHAKATELYQKALTLNPQYVPAQQNLQKLYEKHRQSVPPSSL